MKCKDLVEPICLWLTQKEKMAQFNLRGILPMSCMLFIKPDVILLLSLITQGYPKKYNLKFLRYDNSKIKLSFFAVNREYSIFIDLFNDLAKKTISLQLSCITNI